MSDTACCACITVKYMPIEIKPGTYRDFWKCNDCGAGFTKEQSAKHYFTTLEAENAALRAELATAKRAALELIKANGEVHRNLTTANSEKAALVELLRGYSEPTTPNCPNRDNHEFSVDYGIGHGHICDLCEGTGYVMNAIIPIDLSQSAAAWRDRVKAEGAAEALRPLPCSCRTIGTTSEDSCTIQCERCCGLLEAQARTGGGNADKILKEAERCD